MTLEIRSDPAPLQVDADGVVRVGNARVTLYLAVRAFLDGLSAEEIAEHFDPLSLPDIYATIGDYLRHRDEVDAYVRERDRRAEGARQESRRRFDYSAFRERLLARKRANGGDV